MNQAEDQLDVWQRVRRDSDPDWSLLSIQQVYDVIHGAGIDPSDERIRYDQNIHGLHPVTFMGAWIYVPYSRESIGCLLTKKHVETLRQAHGADSVVHGGSIHTSLEWVLVDGGKVPEQAIHAGLTSAIEALEKMASKWTSHVYNSTQTASEGLLLLWNPDRWPWNSLSESISRIDANGYDIESWKISGTSGIRVGMPCYVLRTGVEPRGVVASGVVVSPPHETDAFNDPEGSQLSVAVRFDAILHPQRDLLLESERLTSNPALSSLFSAPIRKSGHRLTAEHTQALDQLWRQHLALVRGSSESQEESDIKGEAYYSEGAKRQLSVNAYERSGRARDAAIRIHGTTCCVCEMNFESTYGEIGRGFIHIHHLKPISTVGGEYSIDPNTDLVPVCPNCHAMMHQRETPFTPEELRERIGGR
jgi:5-methylcytosine-specific restriction protein A